MKKILIKLRASVKLLILVFIATILIAAAVILFYKPIYEVTLNGEVIGYCSKKGELQQRIDEYIENGNGDNENLAFISIDEMPTYKICLLKRGKTTNDEEIFNIVRKRTAYDEEELKYVTNLDSLVIMFKHYITFKNPITYDYLYNNGIVKGYIQGPISIEKEDLEKIIEESQTQNMFEI